MSTTGLILITVIGVAVLLFLIMYSKMQAFLALLIVSILIGLATGMSPGSLLETIEDGMGERLVLSPLLLDLERCLVKC